jgi:hypothetical protein
LGTRELVVWDLAELRRQLASMKLDWQEAALNTSER